MLLSYVTVACFVIKYATLFMQTKALQLPKEHEMAPRDKYTVFTRWARGYRKGIHKVPKWTRVSKLLSDMRARC